METMAAFDRRFSTEASCRDFLVAQRWPDGVRCPRCKRTERVYALKAAFRWTCCNADCGGRKGYRFSVTTGTIFQDTKISLRLWFKIGYLMMTAKKGMSSLQVRRVIFGENSGTDWRTAWYICHRWRAAMKGDVFPLTGEVEVDEAFIGGKDKNKHRNKRSHITGGSGKVAVIGAISRKGMVVARVIENTDTKTLDGFVRQVVSDKVSLISTDEHHGYRLLGRGDAPLPHEVVAHTQGEYVHGNVHTNSIENFWSLLKRGILGTYHKVGKDYLPLYMNEFSWRFNNRKNPNAFADLITTCGK
jgi:transposase-like protein